MRILVTGGCGFIGSNFIRYMLKTHEDVEIINLDKLTYCGNKANLKDVDKDKRYSFVEGDICDRNTVGDLVKNVQIVVNFAAESHVDRSIKYPDDFLMTNVYGVKVILEASRLRGIKKFIQISTDEIYGSVPQGCADETSPLNPTSPYASTKASGDLVALSYYKTYNLPVIVTRSSNNFGPYQYPEKLIPLFIIKLINGERMPLYGDGGNIRDWLYVEDNARAIDLLIEKGRSGEIYNIGGDNHLSNIELTHKLLRHFGKGNEEIERVNDRPAHDRRYAIDSAKIKNLGWEQSKSFDDKFANTIEWYKENEKWWRPLREKAEIIKW